MEKIILLHAPAQGGKNTCADTMKEYYEQAYKKRVIVIAFADYVKYVLAQYYATPHARTEEYRTVIQHFATDQARRINPNIWAHVVRDVLEACAEDFDVAIIPDWRFSNERIVLLSAPFVLEQNIQVITMKIDRPNIELVDNMTDEQRHHESERNLDNFENFNYNIINETSNLQKTFQQVINIIDDIEVKNDSN